MPVIGSGGSVATPSRPLVGSQPSHVAKPSCSSSPNQNGGKAMPETAKIRVTWSSQRSLNNAESMPSGMPTTSPMLIATRHSSNVAGKYRARSRPTERPVATLRPNSPCSRSPTYRRNCSGSGLSSP